MHISASSTALLKAVFHVPLLYFEHLPLQRSLHGPVPQWKSASAVVSHIKIQPHISLELFWSDADFSPDSEHFFTGGSVIMDYGLYGILVINVLMMDLFHLLSSPDVNWWTGVVWIIVMFLSDSHSDGTHSLQSIHCWDTDAETHFYKPDEDTNSSWC